MRNDVQIPWPGVPDLLDACYQQYYGVTNPVAALSHVHAMNPVPFCWGPTTLIKRTGSVAAQRFVATERLCESERKLRIPSLHQRVEDWPCRTLF